MNRRSFLKAFGFGAAAVAASVAGASELELDPDKLLWVPGAKTIFLPPEKPAPTIVSEAEFKALVANPPKHQIPGMAPGDRFLHTAAGSCVFDFNWNLKTIGGQPVTVEQAARLRLTRYNDSAPSYTSKEFRRTVLDILVQRGQAGWKTLAHKLPE